MKMMLKVAILLLIATSLGASDNWAIAGQIGSMIGIAKACGQKINEAAVVSYLERNSLLDLPSVAMFNSMADPEFIETDTLMCSVNSKALQRLGMVD